MIEAKEKFWTVSLVYSKTLFQKCEHELRSIVLFAKNKDEALGAAIRLIEPEFKEKDSGWNLYLKTVIDATEFINSYHLQSKQ